MRASIIHALRQVHAPLEGLALVEPRRPGFPRWAWAAPAVAVFLVLAAVWWGRDPDGGPTTGSLTENETASAPEAIVPLLPLPSDLIATGERWQGGLDPDPLGQQWEALTEDGRAAARFLLASLP